MYRTDGVPPESNRVGAVINKAHIVSECRLFYFWYVTRENTVISVLPTFLLIKYLGKPHVMQADCAPCKHCG